MPSPVQQTNTGYVTGNNVRLVHGGAEYFQLLQQLIEGAKESIHLQTYIFDDDETGVSIAEALMTASSRGVHVHLLADGYASQVLSQRLIDRLREAGVQFRFFEPVFKSKNFYFGRRMHHKVFVADARVSLTGGVNISNRYNDLPGEPAWLDFALYAEGPVAQQLCVLCWKTWHNFPKKMGITPCEQQMPGARISQNGNMIVRMRRNDWVRRKNEISVTYIEMLRHARSHMTILCSYFLPGKVIRRLLSRAAKRGVKIKVITAGRSDIMMAKHAERWLYNWLLRKKIELYEYQPTVLHGKIAVCDGEWLTVGSYNINNISAYASIELNLDVRDAVLASETEAALSEIINRRCIPVTSSTLRRNPLVQLVQWFSYQFIRIVFYLFTFYYKRGR